MDWKHEATKNLSFRLLSRLGSKTLLVGAALVSGVAVSTSRRLLALSPQSSAGTHDPSSPSAPEVWDFDWDKRNPDGFSLSLPHTATDPKIQTWSKKNSSVTTRKPPTAKRHLLLVRHGQYVTDGKTEQERSLTKMGRLQAESTSRRLQELHLPYTHLFSSTMTRAQETAHLIHDKLSHLELEFDDVLKEGAPIEPTPPTDNWQPSPCQYFQDGARIESAFRKYIHRADPEQKEDSFEVIVCHANVIRYFTCRALQFPLSGWIRMSLANCSLTMITIHPDGSVVLEMMGDHGHIPPDIVSYH